MTNKRDDNAHKREWTLIFKILAGGAMISQSKVANDVTISSSEGEVHVKAPVLADLARRGLIRRNGSQILLTAAGENLMPSRQPGSVSIGISPLGESLIATNNEESPLSHLWRRKDANGRPFLDLTQFEAGERLRSDFTAGQLAPRISANWQASISAGRRSGDAGGIENLTTNALAARQRFEQAMDSLSPDLCGAVVDFCCFLKGLEQVEAERHWPKRSAKFMLRAGLTMLAMHYNPVHKSREKHRHHWGTVDYRPVIS